jgi:hypothetical protein
VALAAVVGIWTVSRVDTTAQGADAVPAFRDPGRRMLALLTVAGLFVAMAMTAPGARVGAQRVAADAARSLGDTDLAVAMHGSDEDSKRASVTAATVAALLLFAYLPAHGGQKRGRTVFECAVPAPRGENIDWKEWTEKRAAQSDHLGLDTSRPSTLRKIVPILAPAVPGCVACLLSDPQGDRATRPRFAFTKRPSWIFTSSSTDGALIGSGQSRPRTTPAAPW